MKNTKKTMKDNGEKDTYSEVFKLLHTTLIEANNKYIKSFLGVRDYINKHLQDKIWNVKLSIHRNESQSNTVHQGRLNLPTVNEIAILMSDDDMITKDHSRYVTVNCKQK